MSNDSMSNENDVAPSGDDQPLTDDDLINEITRTIMDNAVLQQATDAYVRAVQGRETDDDVSDSESYWDLYSSRLMELTLKAITTWHYAPTQEEVVF
jgi:hypothetical protein